MSYKNLKRGQVLHYNVPNSMHMIAGTIECIQDRRGVITLTYVDGTMESAKLPDVDLADSPTYFTVVRKVQEKARKGG